MICAGLDTKRRVTWTVFLVRLSFCGSHRGSGRELPRVSVSRVLVMN